MEQQIRTYVDDLFAETVPSRKSVELKEEMIQNLTEKYNDLLGEGKTPQAAYNIAISGIGDISYLLKDLEKDAASPAVIAEHRQKSAMFTAVAVMLYILSVVPLIILTTLFNTNGEEIIGVVIMFICVACATGLLIYNGMTRPKYKKNDDTIVEEFREWQSESQDRKTLRKAIGTALWTITVAVYIIVSFSTGMWHLTWVIFLVVVAINALINAAFAFKK